MTNDDEEFNPPSEETPDTALLLWACACGRPVDPVLFRELQKRGLISRLDKLERQKEKVPSGEY